MMYKALALLMGSMLWSGGMTAVAADKAVPAGGDTKALNGTWQVVSQSTEGKEDVIPRDGGDMVIVRDGNYTIQQSDMDVCAGTFTVDTTATPMTVNNAMTSGEFKGKTALGIFDAKDDVVKFSWSRPGETERPAGFDAKSYRVTTLKRIKS